MATLMEGLPVDDFDGGEDSMEGYISLMHGVVPIWWFLTTSLPKRLRAVCAHLKDIKNPG